MRFFKSPRPYPAPPCAAPPNLATPYVAVPYVATLLLMLPALLAFSACAPGTRPAGKPAHAFSRQWVEIERAVLSDYDEAGKAGIVATIGDFRSSLGRIFETPLYKIYRFNLNFHGAAIERIFELSGAFEDAVREERREELPALALDIQESFTLWLEQDADLADSIHLSYFYQFFIFAVVISVLALTIWLLGRALSRSRLREEQSAGFSKVMALAQEAERGRISRELHDSVAQELRYQALRAAKIERTENREERALLCAELINAQESTTRRIRTICDGLVPPDFRYQDLPGALRQLCGDFGKRTGIDCRLSIKDDPALQNILACLDDNARLHCFRVIQESLTNIEQHAEATEAVVLLRARDADTLLVCVNDDGKGFAVLSPEDPHSAGHYGIRGMYARAAILKGTLTFESESGEGTAVIMTIPKQTSS
jgi:signal transduction histidine kinase